MRIPVLTAAAGERWESELVAALDRGPCEIAVARRCLDVVDLLAVAAAGQGRAVLVGAGLRQLDTDAVDRLRAVGVVAVGVGDAPAQAMLQAVGVAHFVSPDAEPAAFARAVLDAVLDAASGAAHARTFADPLADMPEAAPAASSPEAPSPEPALAGEVIAVWGPTGAPGRTTVALGLAEELARRGAATLLVDADVYGGVVAALLGLLDESAGVAAACRLAGTARLDGASLAGVCWQVRHNLRLLSGIPFAQRWPDLRAGAMTQVLQTARRVAEFTIVDCGFNLEADEELSVESLAPRRNGATLAVLDAADVILAVGSADAIGLQRLIRGLAELREAELGAAVRIVLNRVRTSALAGDPAAELTAVLNRFAGCPPEFLLPYDGDAADAAVRQGRLLGEVKPASALRAGLVELASTFRPAAQRTRHRRRAGRGALQAAAD